MAHGLSVVGGSRGGVVVAWVMGCCRLWVMRCEFWVSVGHAMVGSVCMVVG